MSGISREYIIPIFHYGKLLRLAMRVVKIHLGLHLPRSSPLFSLIVFKVFLDLETE